MAVLYNTKGEDKSYPVIQGETDDDLYNYIEVEVRGKLLVLKKVFLFRKGTEVS